jgi:hypothetical protein
VIYFQVLTEISINGQSTITACFGKNAGATLALSIQLTMIR